jgi:hypothetical protein
LADRMSATTDTVTAIATCIGAGATLVLAVAAICALKDWKNTLKNERLDDCAGAYVDFNAAIGRYRATESEQRGRAYDKMWDARTRLNVAVYRARRHYNPLRDIPIQTIDEKLELLKTVPSGHHAKAKEIHAEIIAFLKPINDLPDVNPN